MAEQIKAVMVSLFKVQGALPSGTKRPIGAAGGVDVHFRYPEARRQIRLHAPCRSNRSIKRCKNFGVAAPRVIVPSWDLPACLLLQSGRGGPEGQAEITPGTLDRAERAIAAGEP